MPEQSLPVLWPGWETVRLIGRGSFGAVYEIRRDMFGMTEKAALKLISIPQSESDLEELIGDGYDEESITSTLQSQLESIVAEYALMRKMNGSSNVVNCDDVIYQPHANGIGWDILIKMELLSSLPAALSGDMPEEQVVRLGRDLSRALVLCRQFHIVHRDIKPQNIFVSPLGDYKLGDFGIAKTVEKTSGGTKIGTFKYMAPEVYNNQPYGPGADIYSLGLVLYWLLNERRLPFLPLPPEKLSARLEEQARLRRFRGDPIPPPKHGSEALKRIVLKCCAFDPQERWQSAAELLQALEALPATPPEASSVPVPDPEAGDFDASRERAPTLYGPPPLPRREIEPAPARPPAETAPPAPPQPPAVQEPTSPSEPTPLSEPTPSPEPTRHVPAKKSGAGKWIFLVLGILAAAIALFFYQKGASRESLYRTLSSTFTYADGRIQTTYYTYDKTTGKATTYEDGSQTQYARLTLNDDGLIAEAEWHSADGHLLSRFEYEYDEHGNVTRQRRYRYDENKQEYLNYEVESRYGDFHVVNWQKMTFYDSLGEVSNYSIFQMTDQTHGTQTQYQDGEAVSTSTCLRSYEGNKLVRQEWFDSDGASSHVVTWERDQENLPTKVVNERANGETTVQEYEYERVG